jgi:hypothetical protein
MGGARRGEGGDGSNRRAHGARGERGGWAARLAGPHGAHGGEGRDTGWAAAGSQLKKGGREKFPF